MPQSEQQLENELIEQLKALGFSFAAIKDSSALNANLKMQLEKFNQTTFSDNEFTKILNHLNIQKVRFIYLVLKILVCQIEF
jgi:type I restriction enzyme R subunit